MKIINRKSRCGFTLLEAMAAVVILALTVSTVTTVINRSVAAAGDTSLRMRAFEVAREHMETLLGLDSVKEQIEYGITDDSIEWQDSVRAFYEPITMRMWVDAVCTAEYEDSKGEIQKVELTNWLTDLSAKQLQDIFNNKYIKTIEEAAKYAAVDENTIGRWIDAGMPLTDEGYFIRPQLDLYKNTNGAPKPEQVMQVENALEGQNPDNKPEDLTKPAEHDENTSVDSGKIDCSTLPPDLRKFVEDLGMCR